MTDLEAKDLADLQALKVQILESLAVAKEEQAIRSREVNDYGRQLKDIEERIGRLYAQNTKIVISDHAIVRYFERVLGFNIDEIRKIMVPESAEIYVRTFGGGLFPIPETKDHPAFKIRVRNNSVVTLLVEGKNGQKEQED